MDTASVADVNESFRSRRDEQLGRKDNDGQETVIELEPVRKKLANLEQLLRTKITAAESFSEAVKAVAEESGLNTSALRKFIAARASEQSERHQRDARQLALLFDEIGGEISAGES